MNCVCMRVSSIWPSVWLLNELFGEPNAKYSSRVYVMMIWCVHICKSLCFLFILFCAVEAQHLGMRRRGGGGWSLHFYFLKRKREIDRQTDRDRHQLLEVMSWTWSPVGLLIALNLQRRLVGVRAPVQHFSAKNCSLFFPPKEGCLGPRRRRAPRRRGMRSWRTRRSWGTEGCPSSSTGEACRWTRRPGRGCGGTSPASTPRARRWAEGYGGPRICPRSVKPSLNPPDSPLYIYIYAHLPPSIISTPWTATDVCVTDFSFFFLSNKYMHMYAECAGARLRVISWVVQKKCRQCMKAGSSHAHPPPPPPPPSCSQYGACLMSNAVVLCPLSNRFQYRVCLHTNPPPVSHNVWKPYKKYIRDLQYPCTRYLLCVRKTVTIWTMS